MDESILGLGGFIFKGIIQLKTDVEIIKEVLIDELAKAEAKIEKLEGRSNEEFIGPVFPYNERLKAKLK